MENQEKCTVYLLTNVANGKIYVGQTWASPVEKRMGRDGSKYSNSPYIFHAIQKYGVENFKYTILAECDTQEEADRIESENIIKYDSRNLEIGYNLKDGGSHGKHSEETKLKISQNGNRFWLGKELPEDHKNKIGEAQAGKPKHTQEWKDNTSKFMIEKHKKDGHPMQGKHHTDEAKQKISEAGKGRKHSEESVKRRAEKVKMPKEREEQIIKAYQAGVTILKIGEMLNTGASSIYRVLHRNNIPMQGPKDSWTGKTHSDETKAKMTDKKIEYWKNKNNKE